MKASKAWLALLLLAACNSGGGNDDDSAATTDDDDDDDTTGTLPEGDCGNGVLNAGEECDDANAAGGDGCDGECLVEDARGLCAGIAQETGDDWGLVPVMDGLDIPLQAISPPLDVRRLFVVEQSGKILILRDGERLPTPFLDMADRVSCCEEQGLLNITFHPDYRANGRFFLNYTRGDGATVVSRMQVSSDPDRADPDSEKVLLVIPQPYANHNGGQMAFGPDGFLYIGMGDGGWANDPEDRAQDDATLLGKMLRLDVDVESTPWHAAPADNPRVGEGLPLGLVWAKGLRNPWRFSFDTNGDLYIADVGQNLYEEINYVAAGTGAGANFGWDVYEADECFDPLPHFETCPVEIPNYIGPVHRLVHNGPGIFGVAVIGGHVYRGCALPGLTGRYFYSDWAGVFVRSFRMADGVMSDDRDHTASAIAGLEELPLGVTSWGLDARGEMYLVAGSNGVVYKVAPRE